MIRLSVMYPNAEGATFDWDYYLKIHMPMVKNVLATAAAGVSAEQGVAGQGPYLATAHILFDSLEALQAAMAAHAPGLLADIPNYTNIQPVMQVSEVKF